MTPHYAGINHAQPAILARLAKQSRLFAGPAAACLGDIKPERPNGARLFYQRLGGLRTDPYARQTMCNLIEPAKVGDSAGFFSNYQQLASIFCEIICKNCIFCIAPCPTLVLKGI
ncbi:MAG TPA: hypothetical protein VGO72_04885 [Herminiimonas sp.]|nr:hypothetical protein [Herminiimonas sp.]